MDKKLGVMERTDGSSRTVGGYDMEGVRFWSRVGHWFKRGDGNGSGGEPGEPRIIPSKRGATGEGEGNGHDGSIRTRGFRSGARLDQVAADQERIVSLMESVRQHLDAQAHRTERMAVAVDRLGDALMRLPALSETQTSLLGSISESLIAEAAASKRIEEGLSQVPRIADAQRETMVAMGRQLDAARQTSDRVGGAVEDVRKAITDLGEVTGSTSKTMQEIWSQASVREKRLADLMAEQTRRLTLFAWSALGLAGIAAVAGVISLLR